MAEKVKCIPPSLAHYRVTRPILRESARMLRDLSGGVRESVLLWQGRLLDEARAEVTKIVVPVQRTSAMQFDVPLDERMRIAREIAKTEEFILIQVHTHPKRAFHSEADDQMALPKHVGAISIVVPFFARDWDGDLTGTAVFIHLGRSVWRQLVPAELRARFEVVP